MKKMVEYKEEILNYLRLGKRLLKDERTPAISKVFLGGAIAYALSPIDIIPDFIPIIGLLDDIVIIPTLLYIAFKLIPNEVYIENKMIIFGKKKIARKRKRK